MKLYCRGCEGRRFVDPLGDTFYKRCFLGEVIASSFIYRTLPCKNCKKINVFICGIEMEYSPQENEYVVYLNETCYNVAK